MSSHDLLVYSEIGTYMNVSLNLTQHCDGDKNEVQVTIAVYDSFYKHPVDKLYENGNYEDDPRNVH